MPKCASKKKQKRSKRGKGLLNKIINNLPFELHLPNYNFAGPGTNLTKRLARGDHGINPLDEFCKEHDIAYAKNPDNISARNEADKILASKASTRILAKDAKLGERAAAALVTSAMKIKSKLGMGISKKRKSKKQAIKRKKKAVTRKKVSFNKIIQSAKSAMIGESNHEGAVKSAIAGAKVALKKFGGKTMIRVPRILPIPTKTGGALPLIPILAAVSALGGLVGGASSVVKTANDASAARKQLEESKRHNKVMESMPLGKGLFLKPYRSGAGFYLNPKNLK